VLVQLQDGCNVAAPARVAMMDSRLRRQRGVATCRSWRGRQGDAATNTTHTPAHVHTHTPRHARHTAPPHL
jgi:hypothetical protein